MSPDSVTIASTMKIIDERMADGSRHFACLPQNVVLSRVRDRALLLNNARVINYVEKAVAEPWFDFMFRGHRFLVRRDKDELKLYVRDPQCPDLTLFEVGHHLERLSENGQ
jgi:hypothetical protein